MKSKILRLLAGGLLVGSMGAIAAPVQWAGNGHYYEYIPSVTTWTNAHYAALAGTFNGMHGYLATVTSKAENDFLYSFISGSTRPAGGWLGGTDAAVEGTWVWADGPEAGVNFWNGQAGGSSPTYANWDGSPWSEPGGGTENYVTLTTRTGGGWNNLEVDGTYYLTGLFVEYATAAVSVPGPGTLALLGISLAGLAMSRRRKQ